MNPNTDPVDLAKRFRDLSDDELLSLCNSGNLNEVAQSVAANELAARGYEVPEPIGTVGEAAEY